MNKEKQHTTTEQLIVSIMCIILVIAGCVTYLLFASNSIVNIKVEDIDNELYIQDFNKRDVTTIIEKIEEDKQKPEDPKPQQPPKDEDLGKIVFIGDSRTIDMFHANDDTLTGESHDDIKVYAYHGGSIVEYTKFMDNYIKDDFDTLVTWMGTNDKGEFSQYASAYESVLSTGKKLILCTVGPIDDSHTSAQAKQDGYTNTNINRFNSSMRNWAVTHNVKVIDVYSKIPSLVQIDTADGIHYQTQPTASVWQYILGNIKSTTTGASSGAGSTGGTPSGTRPAWAVASHGATEAQATDCYNALKNNYGKSDAEIQPYWDALLAHYMAKGPTW